MQAGAPACLNRPKAPIGWPVIPSSESIPTRFSRAASAELLSKQPRARKIGRAPATMLFPRSLRGWLRLRRPPISLPSAEDGWGLSPTNGRPRLNPGFLFPETTLGDFRPPNSGATRRWLPSTIPASAFFWCGTVRMARLDSPPFRKRWTPSPPIWRGRPFRPAPSGLLAKSSPRWTGAPTRRESLASATTSHREKSSRRFYPSASTWIAKATPSSFTGP